VTLAPGGINPRVHQRLSRPDPSSSRGCVRFSSPSVCEPNILDASDNFLPPVTLFQTYPLVLDHPAGPWRLRFVGLLHRIHGVPGIERAPSPFPFCPRLPWSGCSFPLYVLCTPFRFFLLSRTNSQSLRPSAGLPSSLPFPASSVFFFLLVLIVDRTVRAPVRYPCFTVGLSTPRLPPLSNDLSPLRSFLLPPASGCLYTTLFFRNFLPSVQREDVPLLPSFAGRGTSSFHLPSAVSFDSPSCPFHRPDCSPSANAVSSVPVP